MWAIDRRIGKLVEIRIWSPVSLAETTPWIAAHDALVSAVEGSYACFVDLVDATVFPQDVVNAYVQTMRNEPRLLRTATLLNASPTLGMQIQRMIREANNPNRRVFRDPGELAAWLGEVLDAAERMRLRSLLNLPRLTIPFPMTPIANILHRETIELLVGARTFERGDRCFRDKRVLSVDVDTGQLRGSVVPSGGGAPYQIRIWIKEDGVAYRCTCPVGEEGRFCKHAVATALAHLGAVERKVESMLTALERALHAMPHPELVARLVAAARHDAHVCGAIAGLLER